MIKHNEVVTIASGSNLGDRLKNLLQARQLVSAFVDQIETSSIYETPPWGVLDQPRFFNQVIRGRTVLAPLHLLDRLKAIEKAMGRQKTIRFGPRIIDLDILLYGKRIINYRRLQVPHPRMLERAFVLVPLIELSPGLIIPGANAPLESSLQKLDRSGILKVASGLPAHGD